MDERLPQYLHRPVQILWFGSDEFLLATSSVFVAAIVGGLVGWALIAALLLFIPWKRTKPRAISPISPGAGVVFPFLIIRVLPRPAFSSERHGHVRAQNEPHIYAAS